MDGLLFSSGSKTAFRLVLLESMNNLQSAGLCSYPKPFINPSSTVTDIVSNCVVRRKAFAALTERRNFSFFL